MIMIRVIPQLNDWTRSRGAAGPVIVCGLVMLLVAAAMLYGPIAHELQVAGQDMRVQSELESCGLGVGLRPNRGFGWTTALPQAIVPRVCMHVCSISIPRNKAGDAIRSGLMENASRLQGLWVITIHSYAKRSRNALFAERERRAIEKIKNDAQGILVLHST